MFLEKAGKMRSRRGRKSTIYENSLKFLAKKFDFSLDQILGYNDENLFSSNSKESDERQSVTSSSAASVKRHVKRIAEERKFGDAEYTSDETGASFYDWWLYQLENRVSSNPDAIFVILMLFFASLLFSFTVAWKALSDYVERRQNDDDKYDDYAQTNYAAAAFMVWQAITVGGADLFIPDFKSLRFLYCIMLLCGIVLIAILIGFVSEKVQSYMNDLNDGHTKG